MFVSPGVPVPSDNPWASGTLSAVEFCFGAFIVIGDNVFHIVPNEVIVSFCDRFGFNSAARRQLVCDRIETTGIMAADFSNCACRCDLADLAWAIPNRTCDGLFSAETDRADAGKRDHREREDCSGCFIAGVDVRRFWRRDRVPRISPDACS